MNTIQSLIFKLAFLLFAGFSAVAEAATVTSKIAAFTASTYSGTPGLTKYTVKIGGYDLTTTYSDVGDLAQEAFLRNLTVTIEYDLGPLYPGWGYLNSKLLGVTIQSFDLP